MCSLVVILCTASNVHPLTGACSGLTSDIAMCRTWASHSLTEAGALAHRSAGWLAVLEQELCCATFCESAGCAGSLYRVHVAVQSCGDALPGVVRQLHHAACM